MYPFKGSNHNGCELQSRVPMSRLSISQGSTHLSRNVPVQVLEPQQQSKNILAEIQLEVCHIPRSRNDLNWSALASSFTCERNFRSHEVRWYHGLDDCLQEGHCTGPSSGRLDLLSHRAFSQTLQIPTQLLVDFCATHHW